MWTSENTQIPSRYMKGSMSVYFSVEMMYTFSEDSQKNS